MRMIVVASLLIMVVVTGCAGENTSPQATQPRSTGSTVPDVEQTRSAAAAAIPADEVFSEVPRGFSYERDEAVETAFETQFEQLFSSLPQGVALDSVAARRVLDDSGEVQGSVLVISIDIADPSLVPQFQEGLVSGLGEGVRELDVAGVPVYYKRDSTANGQDLVLFFHEETVAVQAYGINPRAAKQIAAALADVLAQ